MVAIFFSSLEFKIETIVCENKSFREQVENLCLLFRFLQKKTAWRDCPHIFKDFTQRHYEVLEKNDIFLLALGLMI